MTKLYIPNGGCNNGFTCITTGTKTVCFPIKSDKDNLGLNIAIIASLIVFIIIIGWTTIRLSRR